MLGKRHNPAEALRMAASAGLLSLMLAAPVEAEEALPSYLDVAVGSGRSTSPAEIATSNITALDDGMQTIYAKSLEIYKANIRQEFPVIIARFDNWGGSLSLYPPGRDAIQADPVPEVYALVKSVSHSAMAMYQLAAPYLADPGDTSWRGPMASYLARVKTARESLDDAPLSDDVRARLAGMLDREIEFMEHSLQSGSFTFSELESFAHAVEPDVVKNVALAAQSQVDHWEKVIGGWKKMLGADWDRTYAVTNTLYVTRQNNVLFTLLAQFMGEEAIDDRLILVGTTEFTTSEDELFDVLARIIADRPLGKVFFRNLYLMDAELLGSAARHAIEVDAEKEGQKALLPALAPFDTHQWPWPTDPTDGSGPASMSDIAGD